MEDLVVFKVTGSWYLEGRIEGMACLTIRVFPPLIPFGVLYTLLYAPAFEVIVEYVVKS